MRRKFGVYFLLDNDNNSNVIIIIIRIEIGELTRSVSNMNFS
jgi:hypothetical protein